MKFMVGLRVWGNWGIGETVLKVFLRLRGSANCRVDLYLPLIASFERPIRLVRHGDGEGELTASESLGLVPPGPEEIQTGSAQAQGQAYPEADDAVTGGEA